MIFDTKYFFKCNSFEKFAMAQVAQLLMHPDKRFLEEVLLSLLIYSRGVVPFNQLHLFGAKA